VSKRTPFDSPESLDQVDVIAEYLNASLEEMDPQVFLSALRDVAFAKGIAQLARDAGLEREKLLLTLSPGAEPSADLVMEIARVVSIKLRSHKS